MDDLIRREDAIKVLYKYSFVSKDVIEKEINTIPSADLNAEFAEWGKLWFKEELEADRPQGWIPCSERLPSEKDYIGDVVIWCTDKSIVGVGWYYESTKSWATIDDTFPPILGEVIAWMPLPKPWKGADDETDND